MATKEVELEVKSLTSGPNHHFFGYYDKFPWDATGRYVLALETTFIDRPPTASDEVVVGMVDLHEGGKWIPLDTALAWNWQQGTMLQWMPTAPDRLIIYNKREGDRFVSCVRDVHTGEARMLPRPIYAVSPGGRKAVSVNFSRIHAMRPGYGYAGPPDPWQDEIAPGEDGIHIMDLETGEQRLIVSLAQIAELAPRNSMKEAKSYFNHLQFCRDGSRFLFLHRWGVRNGWRLTRLLTSDPEGAELCCVEDSGLVSHFDWRDARHIIAWAGHDGVGNFYYLYEDLTKEWEVIGRDVLTCDGHCSYSPDTRWILTDTYPGEDQKRALILFRPEDGLRVDIGRFHSPPEVSGEIRCDLHPRWNRDGTQVCFDSVHEGSRQMYVVDVSQIVKE